MSNHLIATEEIRDAIALEGRPVTAQWLANDLVVSESTVRRHLKILLQRHQVRSVIPVAGSRRTRYTLTALGRSASETNEGL